MLRPREFPETRASLLATVQAGAAPASWREFFDLYAPAVYRVARLRGIGKHDADDIVQHVMMDLARGMDKLHYDRDRGRFRNWVRSIAEHKIADCFRKQRREFAGEPLDHPDDAPNIHELWEQEWRMQDMLQCLDEVVTDFAPRRIEAFRLYVMEGVPAGEVAARLDLSVGHVYVIRTQILKRIRERLRELSRSHEG